MAINKNKVIAAAQKYVQKGQFDKAIKEYRKIVEAEPEDVRTWLKIGDLQAKKGAPAEATDTYLRVANHYSEQGFYLKAVAVYKQVLLLQPRFVEVHLKLAALYQQLGLLTDARRQLEVAHQVLAEEGRVEDSMQVLRAMTEIDPENVAVRIRLAETLSKEKKVDDAVEEFTRAGRKEHTAELTFEGPGSFLGAANASEGDGTSWIFQRPGCARRSAPRSPILIYRNSRAAIRSRGLPRR